MYNTSHGSYYQPQANLTRYVFTTDRITVLIENPYDIRRGTKKNATSVVMS